MSAVANNTINVSISSDQPMIRFMPDEQFARIHSVAVASLQGPEDTLTRILSALSIQQSSSPNPGMNSVRDQFLPAAEKTRQQDDAMKICLSANSTQCYRLPSYEAPASKILEIYRLADSELVDPSLRTIFFHSVCNGYIDLGNIDSGIQVARRLPEPLRSVSLFNASNALRSAGQEAQAAKILEESEFYSL
jgi:hypothetical protein